MAGAGLYKGRHRRARKAINRRIAGLATALGLTLMSGSVLGLPMAVGADDPVIVPGNPSCEVGDFSFKDENGPLSAATNGDVAISYPDSTHTTVVAASGFTIIQVIVKAGPNAAIYSVPPFVNLASIENNAGQIAEISHVEVCYSSKSTTTTQPTSTSTSTSTTQPATTQPTTTTGPTTTPTSGGPTEDSSPVVSVLPIEIDQTELPQTGISNGWTAALGGLLLVAGVGLILGIERQAVAHRTRLLRRL